MKIRSFFLALIVFADAHCSDQFISLSDFMQDNNAVQYQSFGDKVSFEFQPFPLSLWPEMHPTSGNLFDFFICTIPQGRVYSCNTSLNGFVVGDQIISDFMWPSRTEFLKQHGFFKFEIDKVPKVRKISGKVAVIAQTGSDVYYHWITEVLARLAMLEIAGIEYDWLYVCTDKKYMKDSLQLWGVDTSKIISVSDQAELLQADELIVPSLPARFYPDHVLYADYTPAWIFEYVRNKFLPRAQEQIVDHQFCKKVFISRKDSSIRNMLNEDEVFALFEPQGFVRYELSKYSFLQQIMLFKNAEIIVAAHGSGLTNTIFCDPGTKIIEIFQQRCSVTFWYQSQMLGLDHTCVKTVEFDKFGGHGHTFAPIEIIQDLMKNL